jgi:hypothetical protein
MCEGVRAVSIGVWVHGMSEGMHARASCVTCDMCVQHVCVYVERASDMCVCMHTCGQAGMSPVRASVHVGGRAVGTQAGVHV